MMQFLNWYGEHPWLGTFILIIIGLVIVEVVRAIFKGINKLSS